MTESRKGRISAAMRGEAAQASVRKRAALDAFAPSARPLHVQDRKQTDDGKAVLLECPDDKPPPDYGIGGTDLAFATASR